MYRIVARKKLLLLLSKNHCFKVSSVDISFWWSRVQGTTVKSALPIKSQRWGSLEVSCHFKGFKMSRDLQHFKAMSFPDLFSMICYPLVKYSPPDPNSWEIFLSVFWIRKVSFELIISREVLLLDMKTYNVCKYNWISVTVSLNTIFCVA